MNTAPSAIQLFFVVMRVSLYQDGTDIPFRPPLPYEVEALRTLLRRLLRTAGLGNTGLRVVAVSSTWLDGGEP